MIYQLSIRLDNVEPEVSRVVVVEDDMTLFELHLVVQIAMGWENCHLWQFEISQRTFTDMQIDEYLEADEARGVLLREILPLEIGFEFDYTYDYGDNWEHTIRIEKIQKSVLGKRYPLALSGENACPPEDCGGESGYAHLLFLLKNPQHPDYQARIVDWLSDDFNPTEFDLEAVNDRLEIFDQIRDLM